MSAGIGVERTGVIHGRFQVLHNDHLAYLLDGMSRCDHLVVGITNPEPALTKEDRADPARSRPDSNPLSYYERSRLVSAALLARGVDRDSFTVTPLPINLPERYGHYVPLDAVFFLTIYDAWGRRKLELFRSLGLKVEVLREVAPSDKGLSATEVRHRMARGMAWEDLVPAATVPLLLAWDVPARLRRAEEW